MVTQFPKHTQPLALLAMSAFLVPCGAQTLYTFGNPTAKEQSYIELINRARQNPAVEGVRLASSTDSNVLYAYQQYGVDLTLMKNEFSAIAPSNPVAPNAKLTAAARGHTLWMFTNAIQSHDETNPANTPDQRITAAGYNWSTSGENIYAYAKSIWHGHAGFQVDWGTGGTGGMQSPRGHRESINNPDFVEIGVGTLSGTNGPVGPQLVTEDFGTQPGGQAFATGVAYYDLNSNNFYDVGEGIAGLAVNVSGATFYCTTAIGGGWVVPIPNTAASRTVSFSGKGISQMSNLIVTPSANKKLDLKLLYTPPTITSSASAVSGSIYSLAFTAVGGASGYQWNRWNMEPAPAENCETLTNVKSTTTSPYSVVNTAIKQEGSASYHLVDPGTPGNQILELNSLFHGGATPTLTFQSWLRLSTSSEHHKIQVRERTSTIWQDVYNQDGGTAEISFSAKQVNLTKMAGKDFRVRFILNFPSGSTYADTGDSFGWFIDAISFAGISRLTQNVSQTLSTTQGSFTPAGGNYLLSVSPLISGAVFPGTAKVLTISK